MIAPLSQAGAEPERFIRAQQGCGGARRRRSSHAWRSFSHARKNKAAVPPAHPGTRVVCCRCCLPALAEFTNYRRERTNGTTIETGGESGMYSAHPVPHPAGSSAARIGSCRFVEPHMFIFAGSTPASSNFTKQLAERAGFEPAKRYNPLTHFPGVLLQPLGHLSAPLRSLAQKGSKNT